MPKRKNSSRSYGYVGKNEKKAYSNEKKTERRPRREYAHTQRPSIFLGLLTMPLKLLTWAFMGISWIIRKIFQLLGFLWTKIPGLDKKKKQALRRNVFKLVLLGGVLGFISIIILFAWASKDLPDPNSLTDRKIDQSTKIYDRTGEHVLYEIFAEEKRTLVELDAIPKHLVNGVIATEDTRFYEHKGVRPLSIARAFVYGIIKRQRVAGTSTLTQQLVKNAILTNDRSVARKIKEAIISIRLEQKYNKDQILKIYFNEIPYGSTNYGAQAAAQSYFGKDVSDLNLQECATLAGLPKSPSRYLGNTEALRQRRDFVLGRMYAEGYITEEEKNTAQDEPLTLERNLGNIKAPHFVLYVREQLVEKYGEQTVDTGGLKVITSLDWEKQEIAEKAVEEVGSKVLEEAEADNTSLVALDPKTGHILAMVGSYDFYNEEIKGQFNVATLGKRQPGSSFKPIVYTAAFEKGYTPETVLFDAETDFGAGGKSYKPLNYNLKELGPVTMRQALQGSLNIPAVKTLYLVGAKKGVEFAERLGYTTLGEGDFGLSLVLGGGEVKLLDHVAAFSVFANNGVKQTPVSVLKVEDSSGDVLEEWKSKRGEKVLDKEITATISNVLSDDEARTYAFGAGGILTLPGRPVAAKTGTTNSYVDAWTVGYTPSLAAGVWAGNTDNTPMKRGYGGSKVAAPIWNKFMSEALKDSAVESFPSPPENNAEKPVLHGATGGGITLRVDKVTGKIASSSTPENYIVERTYIQPHSILHYVFKDEPRGDYPKNPNENPQYETWEASIQDWIKRQKEENPEWEISFEDPPTDYDDESILELVPTLEVVFPSPSSTLTSRQIDTDIRASAKRGISKVTYRLDKKYVGVIREHPFNLNYYAHDLTPGAHTLTVIAEDDTGNKREEVIPFTLKVGSAQPGVFWKDTKTVEVSNFPKSFFLSHTKLEEIKQINFYAEDKNSGERRLVGTVSDFSNLTDNQVVFTWGDSPGEGVWTLTPEVELKNGNKIGGEKLTVEVK